MSSRYLELAARVMRAVGGSRDVSHLTQGDIDAARLYSYAYRTQTVGVFHSTRVALDAFVASHSVQSAQRRLRDLQALSMRPVPTGLRAAAPTLGWYHDWSDEVVAALTGRAIPVGARMVRDRFQEVIGGIRESDGIVPSRDDDLPVQASYKVPGIEVVIVPLVYGDHISWNTAYVTAGSVGATTHRHALQAEIHLGYGGVNGRTLLDGHATTVTKPYVMPIPPMIGHGFDNLSDQNHFVPFVFGSKALDGWGVFFDVEPQPAETHHWPETPLESPVMNGSCYLEPILRSVRGAPGNNPHIIVDSMRTSHPSTGGLELAARRVGMSEMELQFREFRILSLREGELRLSVAGAEVQLRPGDHVGIPGGIPATLCAVGCDALLLEASLKTY